MIIVTDGEIEDVADVPPDLRAQAGVRLFPRSPMPDLAVASVTGPGRVTTGDSIPLEIEIRATDPGADSVILTVQQNARLLAREVLRDVRGSTRRTLTVSSRALRPGDNLLTVRVDGPGNAEARDDARLHLVTVTPTPGVVLIANPPDWDSRFLYRTLREVAQLPVRGYVRVQPGQWRSMADLAAIPEAEVGRAVRQADLLVVKGRWPGPLTTGARGVLRWPSGEDGAALLDGDWYLTPAAGSPVAGAFVGQPVDSFPPAFRISPIQPAADDWVALSAQNARRGAERPVVTGRTDGNRREIHVAVDGLWRWAFRGGSSEQAYRAWVAASASWLLGGADSVRGRARPVRAVVQNQRPVVFEWLAPGRPVPLAIGLDGESGAVQDTLHFDGAGLASIRLPVGTYRYRLEGAGAEPWPSKPGRTSGCRARWRWRRGPPSRCLPPGGPMPATGPGCSGSASWAWPANGGFDGVPDCADAVPAASAPGRHPASGATRQKCHPPVSLRASVASPSAHAGEAEQTAHPAACIFR